MSSRDKGREALNGGTNGEKEVGGKADAAGEWRSRGRRREDANAESESDRRVGGARTGMVGVGSGFAGVGEMRSCVKAPQAPPGSCVKDTVVKRWIARALAAEARPRQ